MRGRGPPPGRDPIAACGNARPRLTRAPYGATTDPFLGRPRPAAGRPLAVRRPGEDGIDLHIGPRDRLALIGRNGAGKTTLFRLIDDRIEADHGLRKVKPGTRIVVLEQEPDFSGCDTLMDFALRGPHAPAEHEVEAIAGQLGIDMATRAAGASGARNAAPRSPGPWRRSPTCC